MRALIMSGSHSVGGAISREVIYRLRPGPTSSCRTIGRSLGQVNTAFFDRSASCGAIYHRGHVPTPLALAFMMLPTRSCQTIGACGAMSFSITGEVGAVGAASSVPPPAWDRQ